jgi:hypothetical protein
VRVQQMTRVIALLYAIVVGLLPGLGNAASCILPVPSPEIGEINEDELLPDGRALIAANRFSIRSP